MSIEQKAKAYDDALKRARKVHRNYKHLFPEDSYSEDIEEIFPELRESEDEMMMREFNDWLCEEIECRTNDLRDEKDRRTLKMLCYVLKKFDAWLEKQKEQKPELVQHPPITFAHNSNASRDERLKAALLALLNSDLLKVKEGGYFTKQDLIEWVERIPTDKPVEWNEEDKNSITTAIRACRYMTENFENSTKQYEDAIERLKSLRPRPSWKPSEEHLSALLAIFNDPNNIGSQTCQLALTDLYEKLKRL